MNLLLLFFKKGKRPYQEKDTTEESKIIEGGAGEKDNFAETNMTKG